MPKKTVVKKATKAKCSNKLKARDIFSDFREIHVSFINKHTKQKFDNVDLIVLLEEMEERMDKMKEEKVCPHCGLTKDNMQKISASYEMLLGMTLTFMERQQKQKVESTMKSRSPSDLLH